MKLVLLFCSLAVVALSAETTSPFTTPAAWQFGDPAAWKWSEEGGTSVLTLHQPQVFKPTVRSPFNLAWFPSQEWKTFTLTVEARLTKFDATNNDLCIAFARQGETRFYYAHLGVRADGVHHQIHLVDNADRRAITATRTTGTPWKPGTWHRLKVVHDAPSGKIAVYFDDMDKPVLTAEDKTLTHGSVGVGSFDDLGQFRNLEVRAE